jgi:hypothetical protein
MTQPGNNLLYLFVGVLVVAVGFLSYLYFYKEGHTLSDMTGDKPGFNLHIDSKGISGTVTPSPEDDKK